MEYSLAKRVLKKSMNIVGIKSNAGVVIKTAGWMKEQAHTYEKRAGRKLDISIETNAERRIAYPNLSRAIECVINRLSEEGEHSFKNILVIKNPYQYSPLCALAIFETKKPCRIQVTVHGKTPDCDISYILSQKVTSHRVPIMGLYADYENCISIDMVKDNGKISRRKTFKMHMPPLKGKSATIKVQREITKDEYLYGLTLVYGGDDGIYPYAFDRNGDIRFAFAMSPKTYGFQPISKGKYLFLNKHVTRLTFTNPASTQLFEVDQMGRFHKTYNIEKGAHHDFAELQNGNFVMGSNSIEGETYEDTVIEVDRKTGEILNEIKIKDYIDSRYVDTSDWAHLNSIEYDPEEKTVMVNLRNLHSVMKIDYEKKELLWILGSPEFWKGSSVEDKVLTPVGENMKWFFQAHGAYFIDADLDGNPETKHLLIYDNHTQKRVPVSYFDNDEKSYVTIYTINEKSKTVSLFKAFPCENSKIRSNGIFEKEAEKIMAMNGKLKNKSNGRAGSITEFDYNSGQVVNQFSVNYGFYRAYEMKFEADEMVNSLELDSDYYLGRVYDVEGSSKIDVSNAKKLPEPILEAPDKTEDDRKERLKKICKKDPDYFVDPKQDMARISMTLEEDVLYVTLLDHFLERIYFVGAKHTYFRDFTDTKQERPEYFARAGNTDAIPLKNLEEDVYKIYFRHSIGLYESGYYVKIIKQ